MKILQVAPLWERVPPPAYGGTEAVVSVLTDALVRAGHEVDLLASGDSWTAARLRSVYHRSLRTADGVRDATPYGWVHAAEAIALAREFAIVHNHAGESVMALAGLSDTPMLTTMHCPITADARIVWQRYRGHFNTVSRAQLATLPPLATARCAGAVHNAIDIASFPFREKKDDYLLCLNRIAPEKGTHLAIEAARRAGRTLIVAGKVGEPDRQYYETVVKPLLDGRNVVYVGEADYRMKKELYSRAACLLNPICWEEPFGLVPVEAMACGTPVIAFTRGSMPELVVDGETGFLVHDVDSMVAALARIDGIQPALCRRHVETNFDVPVMVEAYLRLYREIIGPPASVDEPAVMAPVLPFQAKGDGPARAAAV
jgi:glycosyltransferase involved in cell wall biosynthesis